MKYVRAWAFVLFAVGACTGSSRYYWGQYEATVYRLEVEPEDPGVIQQSIIALNEDLERARSRDQPVPPGFHAHLGYLYAVQGDLGQAVGHLEQEKVLFPESSQFVDGLLARLKK